MSRRQHPIRCAYERLEPRRLLAGNVQVVFDAVSYTHLPSPRDRTRSRMPSSA